jgi:hypothetical protein
MEAEVAIPGVTANQFKNQVESDAGRAISTIQAATKGNHAEAMSGKTQVRLAHFLEISILSTSLVTEGNGHDSSFIGAMFIRHSAIVDLIIDCLGFRVFDSFYFCAITNHN